MVMIRRGRHKFVRCPGDPDQLFDVAADPRELTNLAASLLDQKKLATVEEIRYKSSHDGRMIHGWIVKPAGFDAFATWSDPGEPGGKPKEIQRIKVQFSPGGRLDTRALPTCNASAEDIAIKAVRANSGKVLEEKTQIGPHGFRAVMVDSEGNRIALHSSA